MKKQLALLLFACTLAALPSVTFSRDTGQKEKVPKTEVFDLNTTSVAYSFDFNSAFAYEAPAIEMSAVSMAITVGATSDVKTFSIAKTKSFDQGEIHERRWCLCDNTMFLKSKTGYLLKPYPTVVLPRNQVPRC